MKYVRIRPRITLLSNYGTCSYSDMTINLGIKADENLVESILNHEFLHALIYHLTDRKTARKFDKLFRFRDVDEYGLPDD